MYSTAFIGRLPVIRIPQKGGSLPVLLAGRLGEPSAAVSYDEPMNRSSNTEATDSRPETQRRIDVVVVSFNSRDHLRQCVEPLAEAGGMEVIVVDNASTDGSLEAVAGLPVVALPLHRNGGFAYGCNVGWRRGRAPYVLFLNPDATIDPGSVQRLACVLDDDERIAVVAPMIVGSNGSLDYSLRRFSRVRSTFARAFFLHRVFPRASWSDEIVRDPGVYEVGGFAEWVSGACMLVRRSALEQVMGFDEGYFMYCEDKDICRRLRDAGHRVSYEPSAICVHAGGASAPRAALLPTLARSRVRYAVVHQPRGLATLELLGIALESLIRVVATRRGAAVRRGHANAFLRTIGPARLRANVPGDR